MVPFIRMIIQSRFGTYNCKCAKSHCKKFVIFLNFSLYKYHQQKSHLSQNTNIDSIPIVRVKYNSHRMNFFLLSCEAPFFNL